VKILDWPTRQSSECLRKLIHTPVSTDLKLVFADLKMVLTNLKLVFKPETGFN
jgi:hypothetical protein